MRPEDFIEGVIDRDTFLNFLELLSQNWEEEQAIEERTPSPPYGAGALGWEHGTIGTFLEAAVACGREQLRGGGSDPHPNPWRDAAEIILGGKLYE